MGIYFFSNELMIYCVGIRKYINIYWFIWVVIYLIGELFCLNYFNGGYLDLIVLIEDEIIY